MEDGRARSGTRGDPRGATVTRVAEWWRAWIERRIPLLEPEPSGVDLLDGVGMMPSTVQPEPEAATEPPASTEPAASDERRLTPDA